MSAKTFRFEIFLISLAAILLEISYTRIFSFKLFYYFTYLTIGIVLLGMGSGGVFVAVITRLRRIDPEKLIAACCLGAAVVIPLGYWIIATTQLNALDITSDPFEALTLVWICTVLFTPFLFVGVILATIFGARSEDINRLYFADLVGAGLGCALCIPLFTLISPPGCIFLSALIFAIAALHLAASEWKVGMWAAGVVAVLVLPIIIVPTWLPEPVPDREKSMSPQRNGDSKILFSSWSTMFRVDVVDGWDAKSRYLLAHDGNLGSNLIRFDGDFSKLRRFDSDPRSTPYAVIKAHPKVLIIGAAGGHEILASLYFGADHVTAVELNPVTVSLLRDHYADYTGHIADHERVTLINGEGRSFINQDTNTYDLIWFVAPDSYAALNSASSGAFVLSESYLYTREMITEALAHLKPGGVICLQTGDIDFWRKPNRATRYLVTARDAFARLGKKDFGEHVLVSSTPEMFTMATILLSNDRISQEQVTAFHANAALVKPVGRDSTVWHPAADNSLGRLKHPVTQAVTLPDAQFERWQANYPYNISSVSDDAPFFWHFTGFLDAIFKPLDTKDFVLDPEDAKGERVLVVLLLLTIVFSSAFLLLPLMAINHIWRELPHKLNAGLYFAALGLGFMFFEVSLIQKLTLFLGYPSYSLTVTLFAILIFSGIGSLVSTRFAEERNRALVALVVGLAALVVSYQVGLTHVVTVFGGSHLGLRILITIMVLAPLGLCLGSFMPIGISAISTLSQYKKEYVAWGWAVNGFFSVISSVLATILAMTFGFTIVLYIALGIYIIGAVSLSRIRA